MKRSRIVGIITVSHPRSYWKN